MNQSIILIGLSGSGKSTVGPLLAARLHTQFIDTDTQIEAQAGRSITDLFAGEGEAAFRQLESKALEAALRLPPAVIATGAGIVEYLPNHNLLRRANVVWLTGDLDALAERLMAFRDRPLLRDDPRTVLQRMAERRSHLYASLAQRVIATTDLKPAQVVEEIARVLPTATATPRPKNDRTLHVTTPGGSYDVVVETEALRLLPAHLAEIAPRGRYWLVSDDRVWEHHGAQIQSILSAAGVPFQHYLIPNGEESKNLAVVSRVYDWLLYGGVERGDTLIALGGGVVGDLAGFVAATILRGISLIQIPTTILAMVDSSIGGKTGVDHPTGKNLIGSFYQPRLVLADTSLLSTLNAPDRAAGWAEAIKHGMILDPTLFHDLTTHETAIRHLHEPTTSDLLRRSAAIKVGVVSGDEREHGDRILLNYGHTIAHALEHWSEYTMRHGEAVAIGMAVEARIAAAMEICDPDVLVHQANTLAAFGLPVRVPFEADPKALLAATRSDKKVQQQRIRWVLPTTIGGATVRNDIPDEVVLAAINDLRG